MITSVHNPKVQRVRALLSKAKERRAEHAFVVEGVRLAEEAWKAGWKPELVLYSEKLNERGRAVVEGLAAQGSETETVDERILGSLSETETSQGILAIFPLQSLPLPSSLDFVVLADTIRDPGNLGTLIRTAAAAGAQAMIVSPGSADPFSPKVVRAGMGAHFRLPVASFEWDEISVVLKSKNSIRVYLADMDGEQAYWEADFRSPSAVMVCNEAEGPSPQGSALADQRIRIPMPGQSESLNAAIAAGVILFEVVRQRLTPY